MQDDDRGVPVRSQKMFLTSIPAAFMGELAIFKSNHLTKGAFFPFLRPWYVIQDTENYMIFLKILLVWKRNIKND
jgi:hypothetical protein